MDHQPAALLLAAFAVGVLAVARLARLITSDSWPPVAVAREWWKRRQTERDYDPTTGRMRFGVRYGWGDLVECPFCVAPYLTAVDLAWALLAGLTWGDFWTDAWWVCNVLAAGAYLAAMVVVRDTPPAEDV